MTEEITPESPLAGMTIENNSTPAPAEQKSAELATTEPKTDTSHLENPDTESPKEQLVPETPIEEDADQKTHTEATERFKEKFRADELQRQLDALKPKEEIPAARPNINDYDKLENYEADLEKYFESQGQKKAQDSYTKAEEAKQQMAIKANVAAKEANARVKHTDYDAVVNPLVPVIGSVPILKDFIAQNPMGCEVAYELAKNPAVLEQIMRGNVWEAGEQLINLAARLKKPVAIPQSKAADPLKPVGARETLKPSLAQLATKDVNAYIALRNRQELKKKQSN